MRSSKLLGQAHAGMGRHLEGTKFQQAQAPAAAVRGVQLVDTELGAVGVAGYVHQQVAEKDDPPATVDRACRVAVCRSSSAKAISSS